VRTLPARYTVDSTRKQNEVCERADGKQSFITKKGKSSMKTQANTQTQPTQNDKPAKLALSKESAGCFPESGRHKSIALTEALTEA
jgi:hypothetical protein